MMTETTYSFLDLKTPKELIGVTLDNKANHALYQAILNTTTASNAKMAGLFNTEMDVPGIRVNHKSELTFPLRRLIEDQLISQIFFLTYQDGEGILTKTCFIAKPQEKQEKLSEVYAKTIELSVKNINSYIENLPPINPKHFLEELEKNLHQNLPLAMSGYPNSLLEPFRSIRKLETETPLSESTIEHTKNEIEQELLTANHLVKLDDDLYFPVNDNDVLTRFEIADKFVAEKIYPLYKTRLDDEIEKINHEEDLYKLEPHKLPNTGLKKRRAEILHKLISDVSKNRLQYPGSLAILTVLLLEKKAKDLYKKQEEEFIHKEYENYSRIILNHSEEWTNLIHYIDEAKFASAHPETWEKLKKDRKLAWANWLLKGQEVFIIAGKDRLTFAKSIKSMNISPPADTWKILAFRELLEKNEPAFPDLFKDRELVKLYGNLLKKAYISYFPWYYPILIHFKFFLDFFFRTAKGKIKVEQETQKKRKEIADQIKQKSLEAERLQLLAENKNERMKNDTINALETICYTDEEVPLFKNVMLKAGQSDEESFQSLLKNEKFQIISLKKNAGFEDMAVLFPLDHEWRGRESKLKGILHKKIEMLSSQPGDNKKKLFPYKMLYNFLNKEQIKKEGNEQIIIKPTGEDNFPGVVL